MLPCARLAGQLTLLVVVVDRRAAEPAVSTVQTGAIDEIESGASERACSSRPGTAPGAAPRRASGWVGWMGVGWLVGCSWGGGGALGGGGGGEANLAEGACCCTLGVGHTVAA